MGMQDDYHVKKVELDSAIRHHCSGCSNCQSDYSCAFLSKLYYRRYTVLVDMFPAYRTVIEKELEESLEYHAE